MRTLPFTMAGTALFAALLAGLPLGCGDEDLTVMTEPAATPLPDQEDLPDGDGCVVLEDPPACEADAGPDAAPDTNEIASVPPPVTSPPAKRHDAAKIILMDERLRPFFEYAFSVYKEQLCLDFSFAEPGEPGVEAHARTTTKWNGLFRYTRLCGMEECYGGRAVIYLNEADIENPDKRAMMMAVTIHELGHWASRMGSKTDVDIESHGHLVRPHLMDPNTKVRYLQELDADLICSFATCGCRNLQPIPLPDAGPPPDAGVPTDAGPLMSIDSGL